MSSSSSSSSSYVSESESGSGATSSLSSASSTEASPRFSVLSTDSLAAGLKFLDDNGYVVLADVANEEQVNTARQLLWDFFENSDTGIRAQISRHRMSSWSQIPCMKGSGVIAGDGIGQSSFLWYCRTLPHIRSIFSSLWGTSSLLTSFDGAGVFRPWKQNPEWKSNPGWWHVDQNPISKPNKVCVQGLLNLYDHGPSTGSLVVLSGSHLDYPAVITPITKRRGNDFVMIPKGSNILTKYQEKMVTAKAGDFILWDSRTVHCNAPAITLDSASSSSSSSSSPRLLRAVAYVCMTPKSFIEKGTEDTVIQSRRIAVSRGITTNHWPHEFRVHIGKNDGVGGNSEDDTNTVGRGKLAFPINDQIKHLIDGTEPKTIDEKP